VNEQSSILDRLEWLDLDCQLNFQRNSGVRDKEAAILALGSLPSKTSRGGIQIQTLKGKQPDDNSEGPDPSIVPIYGKCTRAPFSSRLCKDWIKCFSCGCMGHVAWHCEVK
jgi:hypothetical protein